ncbi:chromate transporter [Clostridium sp.]|uniref:chromate transporter n=1 Tax=Clostridium sp. TaxID=1506 RepID=UPI00260CC61D|nr:chromate transporter [Clostridium sp.]
MNIELNMFKSFFKIGAFTFGGGYAMIPLIQQEVVNKQGWLTEDEFMDALIVAQSLPGVMSINCTTFIGYKISKLRGAIIALLGTALPSILIILSIAMFFMNFRHNYFVNLAFIGISSAVPMLIFSGILSLSKSLKKTTINIIVMAIAVVALTFFNVNPILVIIFGGIYGVLYYGRGDK